MTIFLCTVTPCQYERIRKRELETNQEPERFEKCPYIPVITNAEWILAIVPEKKSSDVNLYLRDIPAPVKSSKQLQRATSKDWEKAFHIALCIIENETT